MSSALFPEGFERKPAKRKELSPLDWMRLTGGFARNVCSAFALVQRLDRFEDELQALSQREYDELMQRVDDEIRSRGL